MEWKEYKAKTVSDAITDALIELGTTSDNIEYEVLEEGSSGLLGLFSKNAVIRVRRKEEKVEVEEKIDLSVSLKEEKPSAQKPAKKSFDSSKEKKPVKKPEVKEGKEPKETKPESKPVKPVVAKQEKTEESAPAVAESEAPASKPAKEKLPLITGKDAENETVNQILNTLFDKLEIKAEIETTIDPNEKVVNINLIGEDTGDLIGKKGQTLDAVQYLASIILNKKQGDYYRVKVDTNNYRERRQKTLENLARNTASKVKKTRRKVVMEPMNPYERRVIHSYLQSDKYVTTKSEGEEPNRRVVVYYKKGN